MTKTFHVQENIGKARYIVSYHDGVQTNRDGSPFFGIYIFHNKKKLASFVKGLQKEGYKERPYWHQ